MTTSIEVKAQGRFRAIVHAGHEYDEHGNVVKFGEVLRETPFKNNKITLTGFSRILQGQGGSFAIVIGDGNATPAESDTTLASYLGKSNTIVSASTTRNVTPDVNGYVTWTMKKRVTFVPGSLGGGTHNIAEAATITNVSFSSVNGSTLVNSRGLLVNGSDVPTTTAVNNDYEYLDIEWEYTEWIPASVTGVVSLNINGVVTDHDYEVIPWYFDNTSDISAPWVNAPSQYWPWFDTAGNPSYGTKPFSGAIGGITGLGAYGDDDDVAVITTDSYVSDSKQRTMKFTWLSAKANGYDGIDYIRAFCGHTGWKVSYDPPLAKVEGLQLDLNFKLSYANK